MQVLESTLVGLKMVDEHRKGGDTTKKFKFIDIFSAFSKKKYLPEEGDSDEDIDGEEDFEVRWPNRRHLHFATLCSM